MTHLWKVQCAMHLNTFAPIIKDYKFSDSSDFYQSRICHMSDLFVNSLQKITLYQRRCQIFMYKQKGCFLITFLCTFGQMTCQHEITVTSDKEQYSNDKLKSYNFLCQLKSITTYYELPIHFYVKANIAILKVNILVAILS